MLLDEGKPRIIELVQIWVSESSNHPTMVVEHLFFPATAPEDVILTGYLPRPDGTRKPCRFLATSATIENYLLDKQRRGAL